MDKLKVILGKKCILERAFKCIHCQQQKAKIKIWGFGTTVTGPPHNVKCRMSCDYIVFFVRLYGLKIYILYIYTNQDK